MSSRRASRIVAYKIISQREFIDVNSIGENGLMEKSRLKGRYLVYAENLIEAAWTHKKTLLHLISHNPDNKKHYLKLVRSLCLVSTAELLYFTDTPVKAVINEWMEICKSYVGTQHVTYCNGVLDRILKSSAIRLEADRG